MRKFHSCGPVNEKHHFAVERRELVRACFDSLIGEMDDGGSFFTIWGPRQTGKTWLMRQVKKEMERRFADRFIVGTMSMQGVILKLRILRKSIVNTENYGIINLIDSPKYLL
ncbi:MAG: hypothetical protein CSB33_01975 [Desulfobacterales bacterium]|nr:MAG: hypothetical protein CSB33_01975 [Desulfobacterales bacterium]